MLNFGHIVNKQNTQNTTEMVEEKRPQCIEGALWKIVIKVTS